MILGDYPELPGWALHDPKDAYVLDLTVEEGAMRQGSCQPQEA